MYATTLLLRKKRREKAKRGTTRDSTEMVRTGFSCLAGSSSPWESMPTSKFQDIWHTDLLCTVKMFRASLVFGFWKLSFTLVWFGLVCYHFIHISINHNNIQHYYLYILYVCEHHACNITTLNHKRGSFHLRETIMHRLKWYAEMKTKRMRNIHLRRTYIRLK